MGILRTSTLLIQVSLIPNWRQIDLDKVDLINNLNSIKLLAVSEAFEAYPDERVDVD